MDHKRGGSAIAATTFQTKIATMKSTSMASHTRPGIFSILGLLAVVSLEPYANRAFASPAVNLLRNEGFEEAAADPASPPGWRTVKDSADKTKLTETGAHKGANAIAIPKRSAVEQSVSSVQAGAYLARCWVKSEAEQRLAFILQDPARPWAAYNYSEISVPKGQWTQIEAFCVLDRNGGLTLSLGGMSPEYRIYHGAGSDMASPLLADDFELVRYQPAAPATLALWEAKEPINNLDWSAKNHWTSIAEDSHRFDGVPVFQSGQLAGTLSKEDGSLVLYTAHGSDLKVRGRVVPSPALKATTCSSIKSGDRTGIRVVSEDTKHSYTAWLQNGIVRIEATEIPQFQIRNCSMRYGILPSFVGSDICYTPARYSSTGEVRIPSTQWFVGLIDGNDSMMTASWDSDNQAASLGLSGNDKNRMFDSLSIATDQGGFAISFADHPGIWHKEPLQEDWLADYTQIGWTQPFQARWMGHFFVSPGGEPSFNHPYMSYSFPIAHMKTRMWGVWFEDWNHYPFYFDGSHTVVHFEKSFSPNGDALIYFLEPAAADLTSPVEVLQASLGKEKAAALLDFDANRIRKLNYTTPDEFMYDRPVCATTTRLSHIKQEEKGTVGVNLATHLFEFIRGIRERVDQYGASFTQIKTYLADQKVNSPELRPYLNELEAIVNEAQAKAAKVYATPLVTVQAKTDSMKKLLEQGKGDGFDCGSLDVRSPAGAQDDLCRRYNRAVLRLAQTAALNCDASPEKAIVAKFIWDQSHAVLRQPTRWEPRRSLYFFEP
ncbi:MAG: hypothetical protein JWM99_245 [Verrucomicrobiales bacterium]|nr:hypothetical protein [Verrucomicrobiales bacterium]